MTLRDKLKKVALGVDDNGKTVTLGMSLTKRETDEVIKIADNYAVEFGEWLMINCDYQNHCVWEYKGIEYTNFELLEIFKKEKGL